MADNQSSDTDPQYTLKLTVVGDGNVGKTSLLISYSTGTFPEEYIPTVFETYQLGIVVDDMELSVALWDTAGQEEYDKLRPLSYPKTDCFILCYAVNNPSSLANVVTIWKPELKHFCPDVPIVLVGTKVDARSDNDNPNDPQTMVSTKQGKAAGSKVNARAFIECSARTMEGVEKAFQEAARVAIKHRKLQNRRSACLLL